MTDILSQDEIDRLLNAASDSPAPSSQSALSDDTVARVTSVTGHLFSAANASIGTLIARAASVSHSAGESIPSSDFDNKSYARVRASFRSGFSGEISFLMETEAATQLADLVLGGEGSGKDMLEEADADALKEAFGQVLGNAAPAITGATSVEVGFATPTVEAVAQGQFSGLFSSAPIFALRGQIKVPDVFSSPLWVVCAADTAERISGALAASAPFTPEVAEPAPSRQAAVQQAPVAAYAAPPADVRNIDLILDIEVEVMVRLGNAEMPLRDIQRLRPGSIIDLDRDTDALVELVVNDRVIAKGELVVVSSDHFALRVTEILTPTERIRSLGGH